MFFFEESRFKKKYVPQNYMGKCRIIGAGSAGSLVYNCNASANIAGGTKKQGSPVSLDGATATRAAMGRAKGVRRNFIFTMNQLGGGVGRIPVFPADGLHPRAPYDYNGGPDPCRTK